MTQKTGIELVTFDLRITRNKSSETYKFFSSSGSVQLETLIIENAYDLNSRTNGEAREFSWEMIAKVLRSKGLGSLYSLDCLLIVLAWCRSPTQTLLQQKTSTLKAEKQGACEEEYHT